MRAHRLATGRFTEQSPIEPSSPYSASKAGADLIALASHKTFGQDVVVTRCSNNYGPYQFPEKLIPLMIIKAMQDEPLPVYGDGLNVRDWIHVEDHCAGIVAALFEGKAGSVYNFGGKSEMVNLEVVKRFSTGSKSRTASSPSSPIVSATTAGMQSIPVSRSAS